MFGFGAAYPAEKQAIIEKFYKGMVEGPKAGNAEWWKGLCTDDCAVNPPGAPPMPLAVMSDMFKTWLVAFPDWEAKVKIPDGTEDKTEIVVHTQQVVGNCKADLPAWGPLPGVKMADASARSKDSSSPFVGPWETGTVTWNAEGTLIKSIAYQEGGLAEGGDMTGVTTMDLTPSTGIPSLYAYLGKPLPGPIPQPKIDVVKNFWTAVSSDKKSGEWYKEFCADGCTFQRTGMPAMPIAVLADVVVSIRSAFPNMNITAQVPDGTLDIEDVIFHTQANLGQMKADLPAFGPFPGMSLETADERAKKDGASLIAPFEFCIVRFNGNKIASIVQPSTVAPGTSMEGVNSRELTPSLGMGAVWSWVGGEMPKPISEAKKELITKFMKGMFSGKSDWYVGLCTDDATFNPPGAPPMPLEQMTDLCLKCLKAFPDWKSDVKIPEGALDSNKVVVHSQQYVGNMKDTMGAFGPFPEITMEDATERAKTGAPLCLPWEWGTFNLNEEGTLIRSATYEEDTVVKGSDMTGVTSMDIDPPSGMICLYKWLQGDKFVMPAPPPAPAAAADVAISEKKPVIEGTPMLNANDVDVVAPKKKAGFPCCGSA